MQNIKRCPFCGSSPTTEFLATQINGTDCIIFKIVCPICGIEKEQIIKNFAHDFIDIERSMNDVIDNWNQRFEE